MYNIQNVLYIEVHVIYICEFLYYISVHMYK